MLADRTSLTQFLIEERRRHPGASGELNALIHDVALACRAVAKVVAHAALEGVLGGADGAPIPERKRNKHDQAAQEIFLRADEWGGHLAAMLADGMEAPHAIPARYPRGKYLLVVDPLDGSAGIDINLSAGTIFSILRAPDADAVATTDFLQPGAQQVCAGYAIYGPSTVLVISVGTGVHAFTLEPQLGEFILTHPDLTIPSATNEFAINASNNRFWEPAVKRYVGECIAGKTGARAKDFDMRWSASLVAETHRILMRGGVFMCPRDTNHPLPSRAVNLLHEANPIAFLAEQAGGRASTGRERVLDIVPAAPHERVGLIFGSREEVERIEQYHRDHNLSAYDAPLFAIRGLFRASI